MYFRKLYISAIGLFFLRESDLGVKIEFESGFSFQWPLSLGMLDIHLVGSLVGVFHVLYRLEERTYNSALLIGVKVSGIWFDLSIRIPIPLGIKFRIVFLFELVWNRLGLFKPWGWFKHLIFVVAFTKGLILNQ
jgi:uncharacterized membrane protein YczE